MPLPCLNHAAEPVGLNLLAGADERGRSPPSIASAFELLLPLAAVVPILPETHVFVSDRKR